MDALRSKMDLVDMLTGHISTFASVRSLSDLYTAYKAIPQQWALVGFSLFTATMAPDFKDRFLVHFWITFFAGLGGGFWSSVLMMDSARAPINILSNNTLGVTYFACWWLMTYCPFNLVGRLHSIPPVKMLTKLCVALLRANTIIQRVDLACALYPGVYAAPLILGTVGGAGGKMTTDAIRGMWGMLPTAAEAGCPTFVLRSAFFCAAFYYGTSKYTALLTSQEAAAVVITVLLLHSVLSDLLGPTLADWTYPIARVLHTVTLIPMPTPKPAAKSQAQAQPKKPAAQPAPAQQQAAKAAVTPAPAAAAKATKQASASAIAPAAPAANGSNKKQQAAASNSNKKENKKSK